MLSNSFADIVDSSSSSSSNLDVIEEAKGLENNHSMTTPFYINKSSYNSNNTIQNINLLNLNYQT